ncbi:uncharacterized protein TNCV_3763621 [Trichonephila clavipes]|uniref:TIL domain-containing protein n=1 Tax=Trichonephila clavipes TaxID=2585209 RepID=A0A8X6VV68_TRICX|nr:uncharacterized protein TNCV_3763621 [Trichonephila clavipes]
MHHHSFVIIYHILHHRRHLPYGSYRCSSLSLSMGIFYALPTRSLIMQSLDAMFEDLMSIFFVIVIICHIDRTVRKCPSNEEYTECSAGCQQNCTNIDSSIPCRKECLPGCVCKENIIRGINGKCVDPTECPKVDSPGKY